MQQYGVFDPCRKFRAANLPQTGFSTYVPVGGVEIKFLDGCNRSCLFCVNEDHYGKRLNLVDADLFLESLFDWIDDPSEPEKPEAVYGTGGEPLMVLDLVDRVFRPLAERGVTTRLVTNGTLLDGERVRRLADMGLSGIKVTYNTADSVRMASLMRGSTGDDTKNILDGIRLAKRFGLWVFIRVGLGRHNYDEVVRIYRLMRDLGVDVVQFKPWVPSGFAADNLAELSLPPASLLEVFRQAGEDLAGDLRDGAGPEVTVSCYPLARTFGFVVKDCANIAKIYCEPQGNALVCNFSDEYLGSWYPQRGGLLECVRRRREVFGIISDDHGITSCPARHNWSVPVPAHYPAPVREPERPGSAGLAGLSNDASGTTATNAGYGRKSMVSPADGDKAVRTSAVRATAFPL